MSSVFEIKDNFATYRDVKSELQYGNLDAVRNPKVTIIVPCYNHPRFLKKALQSSISQDYDKEYEIIVVDNDDSCEYTENRKTVEELNSEKILYYHNKKNIGAMRNWNRGVELARAPYVTFCHDDDMLLPSTLSTLMEYQNQYGDNAILGMNNYIDENDRVITDSHFSKKKWFFFKLKKVFEFGMFHHFVCTLGYAQGSLYSKRKIMELGGFGTDYAPTDDAAFVAKYIKYVGAVQVLEPTYNYRFAENDTYNLYPGIAPKHYDIRLQEIKYIKCPNWLLRRCAKAIFKSSNYSLEKTIGKGRRKVIKPSFLDNFLVGVCYKLYNISKYSL